MRFLTHAQEQNISAFFSGNTIDLPQKHVFFWLKHCILYIKKEPAVSYL